jgi:hypothetical protein
MDKHPQVCVCRSGGIGEADAGGSLPCKMIASPVLFAETAITLQLWLVALPCSVGCGCANSGAELVAILPTTVPHWVVVALE